METDKDKLIWIRKERDQQRHIKKNVEMLRRIGKETSRNKYKLRLTGKERLANKNN